ncbi:histidinol dehydrogenase [Desulfonatronospira sp.]|uniref:histidinol dehydrogenase n=1 Tax=Desulfonatronospira sp. TaxID=1962951 RepID=UPI0025C5C556|nr:histidinol dehydrogenase [Desulfonatronospira sp.]
MFGRHFSYASTHDWPHIKAWLTLRMQPDMSVEGKVREVMDRISKSGDESLVEYTRRFDCEDFSLEDLRVTHREIQDSLSMVQENDLEIIRTAADKIRNYHFKQKRNSWFTTDPDGAFLGQMVTSVPRAGLYVPGGRGGDTPLISSLLMNSIPAQVAGVKSICIVSPPRRDKTLNPYILATAHLLGLDEIYKCGSAWAVAALAYGTASIPAVDMIAGPGNIFVTTAKKLLMGQVGIDMVAGPSELAVMADSSARPDYIAADLLSQAEHDPLAGTYLVTDDADLIKKVGSELENQLLSLPRADNARKALKDWGGSFKVPDMQTGMELVNLIAPEHFELCLQDPWAMLARVKNAGAVFLGHTSPEPVGDYFAGPNHVLPTLGTARFSQALSVENFQKNISILATDKSYLQMHASGIARMARMENLEAHARSVEIRLKGE